MTTTAIVDVEADDRVLSLPSDLMGLHVTPDAFRRLCEANPALRLTRMADGELIVMSPAGADSGGRNSELNGQLWQWNRTCRLGKTFDSSSGFTLPNGFIHSPDTAWIVRHRWFALPRELRRKFAPICPDFVAELMSPSDRRSPTREKLREFMAQGARLGWLLDPDAAEVEVYRPGRDMETLSRPETLSGEDVLPGFVLDLDEILYD